MSEEVLSELSRIEKRTLPKRSTCAAGNSPTALGRDQTPARAPRGRSNSLRSLVSDPDVADRFSRLRRISTRVRSSEYHLTNACNLRCEGCWFFEKEFDKRTRENSDINRWQEFAVEQAARGVTSALLIGGEPTLFLDRIQAFVQAMEFVTISSNGMHALPISGFENVAIALTLFGGEELDDALRGIRPNGNRFAGLLDRVLLNYKDDARATFIYALNPSAADSIEGTVRRIADNGNLVSFNYYSDPHTGIQFSNDENAHLLDEALRVTELFPDTVLSHPYYTRALITGMTEWGSFGYDTCPSISIDHPAHEARLRNGNPVLPVFNAYSANTRDLAFCCTSGSCETCRDSQAVHSWLMTNIRKFLRMDGGLRLWIELSESYWKQFIWSELHPSRSI